MAVGMFVVATLSTAVKFLSCIREAFGSSLDRDIDCPHGRPCDFPQSHQVRLRPLSSKSLPINQSSCCSGYSDRLKITHKKVHCLLSRSEFDGCILNNRTTNEETRHAYRMLIGKPKETNSRRHGRGDNIKIILKLNELESAVQG
jgi:hypothetical protein